MAKNCCSTGPRDDAAGDLEGPGIGCRHGRVLRRRIIPPGIRATSSGVFSGDYAQSLAAANEVSGRREELKRRFVLALQSPPGANEVAPFLNSRARENHSGRSMGTARQIAHAANPTTFAAWSGINLQKPLAASGLTSAR